MAYAKFDFDAAKKWNTQQKKIIYDVLNLFHLMFSNMIADFMERPE